MTTKKCPQMLCCYNSNGGCQNCEVCDCPPNEIDENCDRCWNCANDEGILRWNNQTNTDEETQEEKEKDNEIKEEIKPIEIKAK